MVFQEVAAKDGIIDRTEFDTAVVQAIKVGLESLEQKKRPVNDEMKLLNKQCPNAWKVALGLVVLTCPNSCITCNIQWYSVAAVCIDCDQRVP